MEPNPYEAPLNHLPPVPLGYVRFPVPWFDGWHVIGVPIWFAVAVAAAAFITVTFVIILACANVARPKPR